ncbi:plasma kallikrein-like isoform X2 [Ornithodoros turicata]|uniref:plasma kallikrein-like isoform X2 n=1 Tax=Ornithodoros turicata TaxID=34597 RepID=UPI003139E525
MAMKVAVLFLAIIYCALAAKCGQRRDSDGSPRIIGGTDALPHEFPWQVSLTVRLLSVDFHNCGASVVNENWIITAAHCCDSLLASAYVALFGKQNLRHLEEAQEERYFDKVVMHEKYVVIDNGAAAEYDYCLVRLSEPVNFTDYIGPVCLPEPEEDYTNVTCTATGWGLTENGGTTADILQKVDLPILTNDECALAFAEHQLNITDDMICAGYKEGGKGTCNGDSGGPIVCEREDGSWVQVGIASWVGGRTDQCALPNEPSVFARVNYVLDWIHSTIRENSL